MTLALRPTRGLGPVDFGMTVAEVRAALGDPDRSLLKTAASEHEMDVFLRRGVHIHYDRDGTCEAIECASPAVITLDGAPLLNRPLAEVIALLRARDPTLAEQRDGFRSDALGVGGWSPDAPYEPDAPIASIIAYRPGYYDDI